MKYYDTYIIISYFALVPLGSRGNSFVQMLFIIGPVNDWLSGFELAQL